MAYNDPIPKGNINMKFQIDPNLSTRQIVAAFGLAGLATTFVVSNYVQSMKVLKLKQENQKLVFNNKQLAFMATILDVHFKKTWESLTPEERAVLIPELNLAADFETIVFEDKMFGTKK